MTNVAERIIDENGYVISAIPADMIDVMWPLVEPHLQRVIDVAHGELTLYSLRERLKSAFSILIAINKGKDIIAVNTLEIRDFDSGLRALFIPVVGGNDMNEWMDDFLKVAKSIAIEHGCSELRGIAVRKGWIRKLEPEGWETLHQIVRYKLEK